ncbi:glyoxal oxidase N-terminus-domain-containing protein [Desarmillaria tabescens]|uniref:Glyoxal oxidase N-terminus-domain-containing protein n=1 Tax=Armillaria tabescens TaxID=1929756 RepID=A0AA39KAF0_ARMTA|nr:glyoxal oxidase N-terminus-domain-containing protein [Desarmillaria tabescens]KAK0457544.1 glyoxal oxidase N-terminus-domain-containing protein [Desarmillaria tabescens]
MARGWYLYSVLLAVLPWSFAALGHDFLERRAFAEGNWSLLQQGTTGVSGMQLAIVSETTAIIYDKVEHNPLNINGHIAWAAEVDLNALTVRALNPLSNTWCATGSFLGNGTMVGSGGNPVMPTKLYLGADGLQAIRMFTPCNDKTCDVFEDPDHIHLTSNRWYASSVRIEDGSIIIYGGSVGPGYINSDSINNPTYEFFPPKNINGHNGVQIPSQFLLDTLNSNHFPFMTYLPDGTIFVAANQNAMIFNWQANTETALPGIPNGVRISSPFSAGATLLPLTPENNYTPEVMICGGSTVSDSVLPSTVSSQTPTSAQCSRLVLNAAGIAAGWQVESMPQARVMPEMVLLPDGRIVIVNGAQTGVAGYGNVADPVGQSNADNPAFTPVVYDPSAPAGSRFSSAGIPATNIARVYHSTVSLTPNGTIMLAGSNPNVDVTTTKYPTEYRMEFYSPPYMARPRPTYTGLPATVNYGEEFTLNVNLPSSATNVSVSLMDLGFATHGVHMDQRLLKLDSSLSDDGKVLTVTGPPTARLYPPGPAYLYVVTDEGVPSFGHKTIIGTGDSPPVDSDAAANMLRASVASFVAPPPPPTEGEGSNVATVVIPVSSS